VVGLILLCTAFGCFFLFAGWCVFQLWQLKHVTLDDGKPYVDPHQRIFLRYPPWWEYQTDGDEARFMSHEKDGLLKVRAHARDDFSGNPKEIIETIARERSIQWDEPEIQDIEVNGIQGAQIDSRASVDENARWYFHFWVFADTESVTVFEYRSSVMFGMVDAVYLDRMVKTLRMPPPKIPHPSG